MDRGLSCGVALRTGPSSELLSPFADYSKESMGSEEESGKDWDELEEEARKGECQPLGHFPNAHRGHGIWVSL